MDWFVAEGDTNGHGPKVTPFYNRHLKAFGHGIGIPAFEALHPQKH